MAQKLIVVVFARPAGTNGRLPQLTPLLIKKEAFLNLFLIDRI